MLKRIRTYLEKFRVRLASQEGYQNILRRRGASIGGGCDINKTCIFTEPYLVSIGENTRVSLRVKFVCHDGGVWALRKMGLVPEAMATFGRITIGNNCSVGWDVTFLPGVTVGDNCVIGLGSIVTKDIPPNSVAAGVPARVIRSIEEYCNKHKDGLLPLNGVPDAVKKQKLLEHFGLTRETNHDF
jgi:acetyltransferase-like isoleucine patch superfamily enzyme